MEPLQIIPQGVKQLVLVVLQIRVACAVLSNRSKEEQFTAA
jgi:hypothetical protein